MILTDSSEDLGAIEAIYLLTYLLLLVLRGFDVEQRG